MQTIYLLVPLMPLLGSLIAGLFGKQIGRANAHRVTILGVLVSFILSACIYMDVMAGHTFNGAVYTWMTSGGLSIEVGFLIDSLTVMMMLVVTFVSLMVHIYTIGYMQDDPGYQRFFSYISLFTFSMLMLVMSNNFMQLFFGWEAVGLVSYLLIGFWYKKPTAIFANLKAFLANRVGDFGFLLGIGLVAAYAGSLDYAEVFAKADLLAGMQMPGTGWPLMTAICICLFIGAMGKSAQVPLHVWLPDSMEGPTPISALIHAATMVTAGIFMVARMSPLFELSEAALSFILVIGGTTAFFMGILGIIQNDIKRVVAYSTLSQLGYMTVALGASAYSAAVFHLMTHAFFKALLFLAAGSVIIGMHHDQDIRNMGGLRKYMKWTWVTMLIGTLALVGVPLFSGFYSKDAIIEAVKASEIFGSGYAYLCVLFGVLLTSLYSFRLYFLVFHGAERFGKQGHHSHDDHEEHHGLAPGEKPHESPWVVTVPLVLLAIPSVLIGMMTIDPMLFGGWFKDAVFVADNHVGLRSFAEEFHGVFGMAVHGFLTVPVWFTIIGFVAAWFLYLKRTDLPAKIENFFKTSLRPLYALVENNYYFDKIYYALFARGSVDTGKVLWVVGDRGLIDGLCVNGSARFIGLVAQMSRWLQTGHVYQYAFVMIVGVFIILTVWLKTV